MKEVWKATEYQDYIVSNKGRIKSLKYYTTDNKNFRILSQNPDRDGYMTCTLYPEKRYIKAKVHRLVAKAFCKGKSKTKSLALHKDGVKTNNSYKNLYWGTSKENKADSKRHGTNTQDWTWETAPSRKLQPKDVKRIWKLLKKESVSTIAKMYNLHYKTIHDIKTQTNWKHLTINFK
tara:strand:- start:9585 stop:10115 length:531 start_codon:yes stop_codon:yes gene_type:complete